MKRLLLIIDTQKIVSLLHFPRCGLVHCPSLKTPDTLGFHIRLPYQCLQSNLFKCVSGGWPPVSRYFAMVNLIPRMCWLFFQLKIKKKTHLMYNCNYSTFSWVYYLVQTVYKRSMLSPIVHGSPVLKPQFENFVSNQTSQRRNWGHGMVAACQSQCSPTQKHTVYHLILYFTYLINIMSIRLGMRN